MTALLLVTSVPIASDCAGKAASSRWRAMARLGVEQEALGSATCVKAAMQQDDVGERDPTVDEPTACSRNSSASRAPARRPRLEPRRTPMNRGKTVRSACAHAPAIMVVARGRRYALKQWPSAPPCPSARAPLSI
jgi:hypothetical protein